jgi:hypothetical protein
MESQRKQSSILCRYIKPFTLKDLVESKLHIDMSDLEKDLLEFDAYLETISIIHDEHCHVEKPKKTIDPGLKNTSKSSDAGIRSSGRNFGGKLYGRGSNKGSYRDRTKSGHEFSSDSMALEISRPGSHRLASTRRSVRARSTVCPTFLASVRTKLIYYFLSTKRR